MQHQTDRRIARFGPLLSASLACLPILLLAACHHPPAEQMIRDTIATMQKAGDKQDIDGVIAPLADDFAGRGDDEINLDRKQLRQFLTFLRMQQGGAIHATLGSITVTLVGTDRATADFSMLVTGGTGLIPRDGQMEQVHTGWRMSGNQWQLISADWKQDGAGK